MADKSTDLVVVPRKAQERIDLRGLDRKQLRAAKQAQERADVIHLIETTMAQGVDLGKAMIASQPITAVGAFVLIELLQKTYLHRRVLVDTGSARYFSLEDVPVIPEVAGSILEGAIVANMLLEGESGGNLLSMITGLFR